MCARRPFHSTTLPNARLKRVLQPSTHSDLDLPPGRPSGRAPTTEHNHLTVSLVWHGPDKAVEGATPQGGTESVAHIVQALTSMDEFATLLSINGVEGSPVGHIPQSHSTTQLHQVSMAMTRSH